MRLHAAAAAVIVAAAATPQSVSAQAGSPASRPEPLSIGQTFTIRSRVLHETRRINIYLPTVYADSPGVHLPVLYMPDGGMREDFLHVAGLVQVSVGNGTMRPFMLVGIENTQRRRDLTGPTTVHEDSTIAPVVGGSEAFRRFIRTELMPVIRARYRTTGETGIVGESLAGLFVVETFLREPKLFDTYIAFDPSLWWNREKLVNEAGSHLTATAGKTLYLGHSSQPDIAAETERLADTLKADAPATLRWRSDSYPDETHNTIYHPAAVTAFRWAFRPQ